MNRAFAAHGSDAFNAWMEETVQSIGSEVSAALGDNLVALILGGGYARAEGGVVLQDTRELPYNDLDFVIVVNRKGPGIAESLAPIAAKFHRVLGIDVDFSRPLTIADIRAWPHWLMWTDLLGGHRVITGAAEVLTANAPAILRESPPLIEATRLLLNRGAGLLWSTLILNGAAGPPDPTFVERNLHKCILAVGDAVIMRHRRHQVRYEGRDQILEELVTRDGDASLQGLVPLYREALAFRLRPVPRLEGAALNTRRDEVAKLWSSGWLSTESARTGRTFSSMQDYVAWDGLREPSLSAPARWPRNLVHNARQHRFSLRYPRERLYREVPGHLANGGENVASAQATLELWRRFN